MTREEASYILRKFYADGYKSNNYINLEQALQLAVECLENSPRWISVGDELPKKRGYILVTGRGLVYQWKYEVNESADILKNLYGITHWMRLPHPPIAHDTVKLKGEEDIIENITPVKQRNK